MDLKFCFGGKKSCGKVNNFNKEIKRSYSISQEAIFRDFGGLAYKCPGWRGIQHTLKANKSPCKWTQSFSSSQCYTVDWGYIPISPHLQKPTRVMYTFPAISNYKGSYWKYAYHIYLTWVSDHVETILQICLKYSSLKLISLFKKYEVRNTVT